MKEMLIGLLLFSSSLIFAGRVTVELTEKLELRTEDQNGHLEVVIELPKNSIISYRDDRKDGPREYLTKDNEIEVSSRGWFRSIIIHSTPARINSVEIERINELTLFISESVQSSSKRMINLRDGCSSIDSCGLTNNRNRFRSGNSNYKDDGGCRSNKSCPSKMALVCSDEYQTKVCMDINLKKETNGTPEGNHTFYTCKNYCEGRGARLPTNDEWLLSSIGTETRNCRPTSISRRPNWNSSSDMKNLDYNRTGIKSDRSQCISTYGVKDMVGVLGQWVTGGESTGSRGQFNGGLWTQPASTIFYRTTAHGYGYTDYSIGCRCATDAR